MLWCAVFRESYMYRNASFETNQLLSHRRLGVVQYIGEITEYLDHGIWYGIEIRMTEGILGDCDGSVDGNAYFKCAPNEGIFVRLDQILRRIEPKELLEKVVKLKKIKSSMQTLLSVLFIIMFICYCHRRVQAVEPETTKPQSRGVNVLRNHINRLRPNESLPGSGRHKVIGEVKDEILDHLPLSLNFRKIPFLQTWPWKWNRHIRIPTDLDVLTFPPLTIIR